MTQESLLQPASQKQYDFLTSDAYITVFGGAAASSKAQPLYSKVLTPTGWKTMGDMAVGEVVSTPDGKSANVVAVYNFESKPVYEIRTSSGRKVRACADHLWKVNVSVYKKKSIDCILKTSEIIDLLNQGRKVNLPLFKKDENIVKCSVVFDQIKSIEYIEHDKVRCIAIDSDDHLYITDDFIVTHNTHNGLVRHLQYVHDPRYVGYVIRKHSVNLKGGGGAFDLAQILFKAYNRNVRFTRQPMVAYFPSGAKIQFVGMDGDSGREFFQGLEVSGAMCDEGTHLTEDEIWWLASRLRTSADMSPNIWITCNPDPDSYLFKWVEWYLYPKGTYVNGELVEGRPDPAKNGKVRWFIKNQDQMIWGDSAEEIYEKYPHYRNSETKPKSFKFIGATCHDNPIFLKKNPDYISTLLNQGRVTAERLYYGNWFAREESAGYFKRDWVEIIDELPPDSEVVKRVRCWDIAGTLPSETNPDPDYTAGVQMSRLKDGTYVIEDVQRDRKRFNEVYKWIAEQAITDFKYYKPFDVYIPQDPAAAGKYAADCAKKEIREYGVFVKTIKTSTYNGKMARFKPFSAAAEARAIKVLKADWNDWYFSELERFDGTRRCGHDDAVDSTSDAFSKLAVNKQLPTSFISSLPDFRTR